MRTAPGSLDEGARAGRRGYGRMRGSLLIEQENADGDRRIMTTLDTEDPGDIVESAEKIARALIYAPTIYAARVIWDRPDRDPQLRTLYYVDVTGVERRKRPV